MMTAAKTLYYRLGSAAMMILAAVPAPEEPTGFGGVMESIVGNIRWAVPLVAIGVTLAGLVMWGIGSTSNDHHRAGVGKRAVVTGCVVGIVAALFPTLWSTIVSTQ